MDSQHPAIRDRSWRILNLVAISLSIFVVVRWFYFIHVYSVNVLFLDQWDFYEALFRPSDWWSVFAWQHGPHRQGIGFVVTKMMAQATGWNTRVDAFVLGTVVFAAMLAALALKVRIQAKLCWHDVAIPIIFMTPLQLGLFTNTPNLSNGAMPLLLIILYAISWTWDRLLIRYASVLSLNFLLIYSGFGVFIGIVTPIMLGVDAFNAFREQRRHDSRIALVAIGISLLSAVSFFFGYTFHSAAPEFAFPHPRPWEYPIFFCMTLANVVGVKMTGLYTGIISFCVGCVVLMVFTLAIRKHAPRLFTIGRIDTVRCSQHRESQVIVILIGFTLLYVANLSVGRISFGMGAGQAQRYIAYLIPGMLGAYLFVMSVTWRSRECRVALLVCLLVGTFPLGRPEREFAELFSDGKTRWIAAYLETGDVQVSNQRSGFEIYPDPEATGLDDKLAFLRKNRLSFFRTSKSGVEPQQRIATGNQKSATR